MSGLHVGAPQAAAPVLPHAFGAPELAAGRDRAATPRGGNGAPQLPATALEPRTLFRWWFL